MIGHGEKFRIFISNFMFFVTYCRMCFLTVKHALRCSSEISCFFCGMSWTCALSLGLLMELICDHGCILV